jgi:hypothetical protein
MPGTTALIFWHEVADAYAHDQGVVFELFDEPFPDRSTRVPRPAAQSWACWRSGAAACPELGYGSAGMQHVLNVVRSAGAGNLVIVNGLDRGNDVRRWTASRLRDPIGNLAVGWRARNFDRCAAQACWDAEVAPLSAELPVVITELGSNDCSREFVDGLLGWADRLALGYVASTWNSWGCGDGPALIEDALGTPTPYGAGVRDHLLAQRASAMEP